MRRLLIMLVLSLCYVPLQAQAQLACWQTQFADVIRASGIRQTDTNPLTFEASFMEEAGTLYRLQGPAVAQSGVSLPLNYEFAVYQDNRTEFFGGNPNCRARMTLNPLTLNGTNVMLCTGGLGAPFSVTINMTYQPICPGAVIAAQPFSALRQPARVSLPDVFVPLSVDEVLAQIHAQGLTAAGEDENNDWVAGP